MNDENAFPQVVTMPKHTQLLRECYSDVFSVGGLTKREYFAAAALTGLLASPDERKCPVMHPDQVELWREKCRAEDAAWCYRMADAMIEAGRKP